MAPGGGGVLDPWVGIGVPLRVSNPDPVQDKKNLKYTPCIGHHPLFRTKEKINTPLFYIILKCFIGNYN